MINELRGRFLGIRQQHSYNLYHLFDNVIRDCNPRRFIEIGTGHGAMSIFLGLYAWQQNESLLTFDIQERGDLKIASPFFDLLGIAFKKQDCFSSIEEIKEHICGMPTFFLCDGDNKIKEFTTFKPLLPSGSVLAAHDYPYEINDSQIDTQGLEPLSRNRWEETKTMIWRVL